MNCLLIYDSVFGNTEQVARAIEGALSSLCSVRLVRAGSVRPEEIKGNDLLFVGSPTRGFRPTPAVMSFLKKLAPGALSGVKAASFDTRLSAADATQAILRFILRFGWFAAKPIADKLVRCGATLVAPPEGFYVSDSEGPLKEGEFERAARWAREVAHSVMEDDNSD